MTRAALHILLIFLAACADGATRPDDPAAGSELLYLANEGVAVFHDGSTLLFDPLFREDYGRYALVPDVTRAAMLGAEPPFEDVTAIFVSHYHGDHFEPSDMLRLLRVHESASLYAPRQAVDAMESLAAGDAAVFGRVTALDLAYGDPPAAIERGRVRVDAFYVPHAGWPTARTDVQNIAFRVTIDGRAAVAHLGDADPNLLHFEPHEHEWQRHRVDVALPPYWFFNSTYGNAVLDDIIRPGRSIGIHVPAAFANEVPAEFDGFDLFVLPGEQRPLTVQEEN